MPGLAVTKVTDAVSRDRRRAFSDQRIFAPGKPGSTQRTGEPACRGRSASIEGSGTAATKSAPKGRCRWARRSGIRERFSALALPRTKRPSDPGPRRCWCGLSCPDPSPIRVASPRAVEVTRSAQPTVPPGADVWPFSCYKLCIHHRTHRSVPNQDIVEGPI